MRRGAAGYEWQAVPGDLPTVHAALTGLATTLELEAVDEDRWAFSAARPSVHGEIVALGEGAGTAVGVRISAARPPTLRADLVEIVLAVGMITAPMWLLFVLLVCLCGAGSWLGLLAPLVGGVGLVGAGLVVYLLQEDGRLRRVRHWGAAWRERFWPALHDRLDRGRMYR